MIIKREKYVVLPSDIVKTLISVATTGNRTFHGDI